MDDTKNATPDRKAGKSLPEVGPDDGEQNHPEEIDNAVPTHGYDRLPLVGLGGSAGSIQALQRFFQGIPEVSGMAYVVVVHLSPDFESSLPELLGRAARIPVVAAEDGMPVHRDHVYVIPPGKHLTSVDGHLRLTDLQPERGSRVAVDLFFRSLADTHGPHAAAIVLSGADSDGTIGIKRIKERGGLTIAQDPDEAEHHSMPLSAIATGMVDWVLPVDEMPDRLVDYRARESRLQLPPEEGPPPTIAPKSHPDEAENALREILAYLRTRTGRDFSYYKRATIVRRVSRRLQINGVDDLPSYLAFLRTHPGEAGALLQDLLISVTNFFRDRECFEAVEHIIPELFKGKGAGDFVRVWIPACATGEEAYSFAMLLLEHAKTLDAGPGVQIFGCDLDEDAIQLARTGIYPSTITADVSEERLRRFFLQDPHGYRIRREVREIVLFAAHDLLKDAPFSRMDLISCRNLMIYLNRDAQKRALDIFHFALRPNGYLFLGTSESVEEGSRLFEVLDKKHRIYHHLRAQRMGLPVPTGPSTLLRAIQAQERASAGPVLPGRTFEASTHPLFTSQMAKSDERIALGELHFRLVERFAPPSALVNREYEIVHLSESAGRFLQFAGGEPNVNLLKVVNPSLRVELRAALFQANETGLPVELFRLRVDLEGVPRTVDIRVMPAADLAAGFLLVVFELRDRLTDTDGLEKIPVKEQEPVVRQLERELEVSKARLRDTVEQYEANTEELKASNEELQAMNEELRSASEELETSREELQSINEELSTVNQELKSRLEELGNANSDLHNLMASTPIATIFLDRALCIMRYTPGSLSLFRIIPGDVGRPLADLRHQLEYPELSADAVSVLETLVPVEREIRDRDNNWFLARVLPYRTLDDHIAGVVLAFVDVTESKRSREALKAGEERMRLILESARDYAIFTIDLKQRINSWNSGAQKAFGYTEQEILGQPGDITFVPEDRESGVPERERAKAREAGRAENERWHIRKDGSRFYGSGLVMPLKDGSGDIIGFLKIMRDLTQQKHAEEELRIRNEELERFNRAAVDRELRMIELKKEVNGLLQKAGAAPRYKTEPGTPSGTAGAPA
ncbi:MAG TPA: chemotaxis protein CheB [Candidatus Saccharimonadales bacterium]|nr:chemotaxis protein CheB [Candidatus Saccharimonadales bacterium]